MSFGIVCLKCRHYVNVGVQHVHESVNACECEQPAYSEDAKTEITKEQAEKYTRIFRTANG